MVFNRDSAIQKCFQKILHCLQVKKFGSLLAVRTTCHTVQTPSCPKHQPSRRRVIPSERPALQSTSRPDDVSYRLDAHQSTASSVWTTRTFHPDLPLCREISNCSSLHPSGHFSSTSGRHSVFDKVMWFFFYFNNNTTRNRTNRCRIMSILRVSIHRECIGCMHQALIKSVLIYPLESMLFLWFSSCKLLTEIKFYKVN